MPADSSLIYLFLNAYTCSPDALVFQAFHVLYHTETNVLLGAPTGSGKTISAELAMLHLFNTQPDMKVCLLNSSINPRYFVALICFDTFSGSLHCSSKGYSARTNE